ncbi:unnamed protein product [Somion occarium]|uniref:TEA domain-containing protein n=1 Tax=Somion occarium TaxID=3059160 RepID=A0ABP1DE28_9APHY
MSDALSPAKSLTPQRKHHKLLKDGSEVWSEDVEKIFVEGLREYWESPWATYSRGRSRWRNQFLVDHLKKYGIERSKKQVASHIQVLRNMWREQPEFHLVAGGEELFMENGLLASPKNARRGSGSPRSSHSTPKRDASSLSPTPSSSTSELPTNFPASMSMPQLTSPCGWPGSSMPLFEQFSDTLVPSAFDFPNRAAMPPHRLRPAVKLEPLMMHAGLFTLPTVSGGHLLDGTDLSSPNPVHTSCRLLSLNLWADGMQPFAVDIDRLTNTLTNQSMTQLDQSSVLLRINVTISSIDDILSPPNLHGFQAAITLSERWSSEAKCITKIYSGSTVMSQEMSLLDGVSVPHISSNDFTSRAVTVGLPESALGRCKWLETGHDHSTNRNRRSCHCRVRLPHPATSGSWNPSLSRAFRNSEIQALIDQASSRTDSFTSVPYRVTAAFT